MSSQGGAEFRFDMSKDEQKSSLMSRPKKNKLKILLLTMLLVYLICVSIVFISYVTCYPTQIDHRKCQYINTTPHDSDEVGLIKSPDLHGIASFSGYLEVYQRGEISLGKRGSSRYLPLRQRKLLWRDVDDGNANATRHMALVTDCATLQFSFAHDEPNRMWSLQAASVTIGMDKDYGQVLAVCELERRGGDFGFAFYHNYHCYDRMRYACRLGNALLEDSTVKVYLWVNHFKFELNGLADDISEGKFGKVSDVCVV